MAAASVSYGLKFQARALAPQLADTDRSRWLVGTLALREDNEVQVVEYNPDTEALTCVAALNHPPEVWALAPSPWRSDHFFSVFNDGGVYGAKLWQFEESGIDLTEVADLVGHQGVVRSVLWHPQEEGVALSVEEGCLRLWSLGGAEAQCTKEAPADALQTFWSAAWAENEPSCAAVCGGNGFALWDARTLGAGASVENAHRMPVRDIDFSVQNPHHLVTAGDDCKLRIWDTRRLGRGDEAAEPVRELGGRHSHWVWQSRVNPFHDELVLSSSSDCQVIVWHAPSTASGDGADSAAAVRQGGPGTSSALTVHAYDEHDDSVYCAAWSAADPWTFASLSYDGRVVVERVPNATKYKILL